MECLHPPLKSRRLIEDNGFLMNYVRLNVDGNIPYVCFGEITNWGVGSITL